MSRGSGRTTIRTAGDLKRLIVRLATEASDHAQLENPKAVQQHAQQFMQVLQALREKIVQIQTGSKKKAQQQAQSGPAEGRATDQGMEGMEGFETSGNGVPGAGGGVDPNTHDVDQNGVVNKKSGEQVNMPEFQLKAGQQLGPQLAQLDALINRVERELGFQKGFDPGGPGMR